MGGAEEKTEPATQKKRRDERKKGHVLMSKDAMAVLTLITSFFVLRMMFAGIRNNMADFFQYCLAWVRRGGDGLSQEMLIQSILLAVRCTAVPLLVTAFMAITGTMFQTRGLVAWELIKPKFSHINPLEGVKRLFSLRSLIETVKSLLKITVILYIIYTCMLDMVELSRRYLYADLTAAVGHLMGEIYSMVMKIVLAFIALAVADFFYQRWDFEKNMRMTKQEVKEEYKQLEGDPKIKNRIRQIQREMAQARMMQQVPKADVIIRNPSHVAVALRYRYKEDAAPVVIAKGVDSLAQRIIAIAEEHNIVVMENVPLARLLYAEVELNQSIPPDLYEAVAEVMVYLYRLGRMKGDLPNEANPTARPT